MAERLLTTKRSRSIIKNIMDRHRITIDNSKTRSYRWYDSEIRLYGKDIRKIKYSIKANDDKSLQDAMNELDSWFLLSGAPRPDRSWTRNNRMRFEVKALIGR